MGKVKYMATDNTYGLPCSGLSSISTGLRRPVWGNSLDVNILPKDSHQPTWFPAADSFFRKERKLFRKPSSLSSWVVSCLLLKNETTSSQAESQHRGGFSMVIRYEIQLKASAEILEANYHKVHRYREESCLLGPEWITTTDYKLPEKSVFYLIVLRQGLTYLRLVLNSLSQR